MANPTIQITFRLGPTIAVPFTTPVPVGIPLPAGNTDGDVLVWNGTLGRWEARQIAVSPGDRLDGIALRSTSSGTSILVTAVNASDPLTRALEFRPGGSNPYDAIWLKNESTGAYVRVTVAGPDAAPYPEFETLAAGSPKWDALFLRDAASGLYVRWTAYGSNESPTYQLDQE